MENLIAIVVNKLTDLETKTTDVGNRIALLDDKLIRVTTHTPSCNRQMFHPDHGTASRIHQRNPLPFQSRARLNNIDCGFVKRAEAAQGFSRSAAKFPFTDRQRTGRLELLRAALAWTPVGQTHNIGLNEMAREVIGVKFLFLILV